MTEPGGREDWHDWQGWVRRHGPGLLLAARQWVPGPADAEDVVQEAFLRFWRSRGRAADGPVTDPVAYLYACARRCALEWGRGGRRRARREAAVARPEGLPADAALFAPIEHDERRDRVEAALAKLPGPQREVLVMKVWGGLSFPQIAEALRIPANTAASRYRYALTKLRERLAQEPIP